MYNGIGLMTPRGSGTSGYVMKNLSHMKRAHNRDDFIKELQNMKDNVIEAHKRANPDILLHEQKRDIEVKKLELRVALEAKGLSEQEIDEKVQNLEVKLKDKLSQGDYNIENIKDTHAQNQQKDVMQHKIDQAFGIKQNDYKPGSAFDFETQDKLKLEKQYKRELKKSEELLKRREQKKIEKRRLKLIQKQDLSVQKQLTDGILVPIANDKSKQQGKKSQ